MMLNMVQVVVYEIILFAVNLSLVIMSSMEVRGTSSPDTINKLSEIIIISGFVFSIIPNIFILCKALILAKNLYRTIRQRKREGRDKKSVIQTLPVDLSLNPIKSDITIDNVHEETFKDHRVPQANKSLDYTNTANATVSVLGKNDDSHFVDLDRRDDDLSQTRLQIREEVLTVSPIISFNNEGNLFAQQVEEAVRNRGKVSGIYLGVQGEKEKAERTQDYRNFLKNSRLRSSSLRLFLHQRIK